MEYKYDPKTDILLIKLSRERPDFGEQNENIIAHYNKKGKPVQLEILDASKTMVKLMETVLEGRRLAAAV